MSTDSDALNCIIIRISFPKSMIWNKVLFQFVTIWSVDPSYYDVTVVGNEDIACDTDYSHFKCIRLKWV